jgi:hypothetical protein
MEGFGNQQNGGSFAINQKVQIYFLFLDEYIQFQWK